MVFRFGKREEGWEGRLMERCTVCKVRKYRTLLFNNMNSTEVQNPRRKLDVFGSVLACANSAHVFQKLSYSLCGFCLFCHH